MKLREPIRREVTFNKDDSIPDHICTSRFGFYDTICAEGGLANTMPTIGEEKVVNVVPEGPKDASQTIKKREIDKRAEEIKAKRTLPAIPGRDVDFDTMVNWLNLLTEDMWKQTIVRLYRHDPIINTKFISDDAPKYIDVMGEPFDKNYIIERHGGGKYGFFVNGGDGQQKLFEASLSIPTTQYDPKFDIRMLDVNAKDNLKWVLWAKQKGLLDKDGKVVDQKKTESIGTTDPTSTIANAMLAGMDRATQIFRNASERSRPNGDESGGLGKAIGDILVEKMRQEDPNKSFEAIAKFAGMFKQDNNSDLFKMMLQMQSDNSKQMMELMKEMRKPDREESEERTNPIAQLKELLEVGEQLGVKIGGRGGPRSGWDTALEVVQAVGPPVFNMVSQILQASMLSKTGGLQGQQVPQSPATPSRLSQLPQISQAPTAPSTRNYATLGANPNAEVVVPIDGKKEEEIKPVIEPSMAELQMLLRNTGGLIQKQIMDGKKGWEFAEVLVGMYGVATHAMVSKHGADKIVDAMKSVPEFWNPLENTFGEEHLVNWVGEFINYEAIIAQMDMQDDFDDDTDEDNEPEKSKPIGIEEKKK